jgi:AcrR family transcriptional regulator
VTVTSRVQPVGGVNQKFAAPVRKARAAETRRRMLDAAIRCFTEKGYSATTMAAIAAEARVAVQTLYFTFHTKAELLQETYDRAVLGNEVPVPPYLTTWFMAMEAEPTLTGALGHLLGGLTKILERVAPLRPVFESALGEDGVAEVVERAEALRERGYRHILDVLSAKRPLRADYDRATASDVLFVLLGPDAFRLFVHGRGWSVDRWKAWVAAAVERELFEPQA